jgi:serine/threonine protein kinase
MRQCLNPDCLYPNPDNSQFCQKCGNKLLLRERYWATKILGQGGFGRTFLAVDEDKPSKPPCVIKQFLPQAQGTENVEKASELFAQEAQRLEELGKHPQIPELLAYFTFENRQYLVQEYIHGQTLQQELEENGVFKESQIRELLQDLLIVLQYVHRNQVIHRDIKPENVIRGKTDKKLVLVDFGVAKYIEPTRRTVTGTIIGTPEYCAPEQSMGKPLFISDLYSLGVTCLHLLTDMSPFELYDVMESEWRWRNFLKGNFVSDKLGQILDRLVEPKPKQRYQSAEEVLADLKPSTTPRTEPPKPPKTPSGSSTTPRTEPPKPPKTPSRYQNLEALLKARKWQEANKETGRRMVEVAGREKDGWLRVKDMKNFPCEDLRIIDELWFNYSKGRFGFAIQKQIYRDCGGKFDGKYPGDQTWNNFRQKVGWRVNGRWVSDSKLTFDISAPRGHLPVRYDEGFWEEFRSKDSWCGRWYSSLMLRLLECKI